MCGWLAAEPKPLFLLCDDLKPLSVETRARRLEMKFIEILLTILFSLTKANAEIASSIEAINFYKYF